MMAIRTTYQGKFEFILMYELILCPFILPKCKSLNGHMNSYIRSNETNLLMSRQKFDFTCTSEFLCHK